MIRVALAVSLFFVPAQASAKEPGGIKQLLEDVRQGYNKDAADAKKREVTFRRSRSQQKKILKEAKVELSELRALSTKLEHRFQENEKEITEQEATLSSRLGTMGELFGVVRTVAGDTRAQVDASVISSQLPGRSEKLKKLSESKKLPSVSELSLLWFTLMQEMAESGRVTTYPARVVGTTGDTKTRAVVRIGSFNVVSDGHYLQYLPETGTLAELGRQPSDRYLSSVDDLEAASSGFTRFAVDPSRGQILGLLVETPSFTERLRLGGGIGFVVIALGIFALLVGLWRFGALTLTDLKMRAQEKASTPNAGNPLGRVLGVFQANREAEPEELERKLDEVIVRESAQLERFLWIVKVVSVAAPLLGLLGTVTGMINTFQAITLFGTGDPKLMAGGISEALVTTMLGLIVAIPLVLTYAVLTSMSRRLTDVIEEQSAGLVAINAEKAKDVG